MNSSKTQFVKDLGESGPVSSPFLVKFSAIGNGKGGKPFMNLVLLDRTGEVEARIWENVPQYAGLLTRDAIVSVQGKCQVYQGRKQVIISSAQVLREDEVDLSDLLPRGVLDPEALYQKLAEQVESMEDPEYKALARVILIEDSEIVRKLKKAPAAKTMHHAYPGGLLEHVVSIVGILDSLSRHYEGIVNRDLLFLGGFLHDIGKIWELSYEKTTDYTTEGRLIGHLVMGVELVERKVQDIRSRSEDFPEGISEEKKNLVKHLILAHHGKMEYGSPREPQCLEALIVHMVDDLDSKVNSIHKFIVQDQNPGQWTLLHRQFERFFFKSEAKEGPSEFQSQSS